jgi:hypothetical protein
MIACQPAMRSLLPACAVLCCLSSSFAASEFTVPNGDFEAPSLDWGKWPAESSSVLALDGTVARSGKQSLQMTATNPGDRLCATGREITFEKGKLYRLSIWIRKDDRVPNEAIVARINWTTPESGTIGSSVPRMGCRESRAGDWVQRSGVIMASSTTTTGYVLLMLERATGRVWFDDVTIEPLGSTDEQPVDLWTNQTVGVEIGSPPLARFRRHMADDDAPYRMGSRFNGLLVASAEAEHELRDLDRCRGHAGKGPVEALAKHFEATDRQLNEAYLSFAAAFRSGAEADWQAFEGMADRQQAALDGLRGAIEAELAALRPGAVVLPPGIGRQPKTVKPLEPNGRVNRLLFGRWSPSEFRERERVFDFEFSSGVPEQPQTHTEQTLDLSNITAACRELERQGFLGGFGIPGFGTHEYVYAPQWLLDKHAAEPDFLKVSQDGLQARGEGRGRSLNYFHPAVRRYVEDYLGQYAAFCRNEPGVLFYLVAQEAYPFMVAAQGGQGRETGYGKHGERAFREYLTRKYGTIESLNRAWGSAHADFAAIEPPPDAFIGPRQPSPLVADFEAFREESYVDFLKLMYDSLKAGDPTKPVVADHSGLLRHINGARIYETCDLLSYHGFAPDMQLVTVYLNTLSRYNQRQLAYFEDFWGVQEEAFRTADERAQRRGLEKHVARMCIWGRTVQTKWYGYTTGPYVFEYNGNWFDPRWDLTTMRYSAPALAVAKRQMEQLDWVLTHSRIVPSRIAVLQPSATMRNEFPKTSTYDMLGFLHRIFFDRGVLYELVPEEYLQSGKAAIEEFSVIVVPGATYLAADLQRKLLEFAAAGNLLMLLGETGTCDELTRPCHVLREPLEQKLEAAELRGGMKTVRHGQGDVVVIPTLGGLEDDTQLTRMARRQAPYPVAGSDGTENVLRETEDGDCYLFALNPDVDRPIEDRIEIAGLVSRAVDVTAPGGFPVPVGRDGDMSTVTVRLGPGETAVIWLGKLRPPRER